MDGRILQIEPMGREVLYVVESALGHVRVLEAGSDVRHRIGEAVALDFDRDNVLMFDRSDTTLIPGAWATPTVN